MRIAVCTSLSDLLIWEILSQPTTVLDTDISINKRLLELGITSIHLDPPSDKDWESRDRRFKDLAMPGVQLNRNFLGTNLPAWKVLGLDRLSFWTRGLQAKLLYEEVMALDWDEAIVPLDMHHPLPFALARHSGRKVRGVQVSSLRTREWKDLLETGNFPVADVVLETDEECQFLQKYGITTRSAGVKRAKPQVDNRDALRAAYGVSGKACLVIFESQTEWEFRKALPWLAENYSQVFVIPLTIRDYENLASIGYSGARMVTDWAVENAVDEVFMFRYNSELINRRVKLNLIDPANRWMLQELA